MITSIFEQFEIIRLIPIHPFGNLDLSFTNSSLYLVIALFILNGLINNNIKKKKKRVWHNAQRITHSGSSTLLRWPHIFMLQINKIFFQKQLDFGG